MSRKFIEECDAVIDAWDKYIDESNALLNAIGRMGSNDDTKRS